MLALTAVAVVPEPMSCCGVSADELQFNALLFVLYWNQTWVSDPLGFTLPFSVAVVLVTAAADPVVAVGGGAAVTVRVTANVRVFEPLATTSTVPLYVATAKPIGLTKTVRVEGVTVLLNEA
jgi:hypothetical protein